MAKNHLSAKQDAFARHYAEHRDPRAAYRASYSANGNDNTVSVAAHRLLAQPQIALAIKEYEQIDRNRAVFSAAEALQLWLDLVNADPAELISTVRYACRHCHGVDHKYQWFNHEYEAALFAAQTGATALPDIAGGLGYSRLLEPSPACPECRGDGETETRITPTDQLSRGARLLFGGIKRTKYGPEPIILDKARALENASRIVGAYSDRLNVSGTISQMAAYVNLKDVDPQEASKIYAEIVKGLTPKS